MSNSWRVIDERLPVLWREYSFGHGDPLYGQDAGARLRSVIRAGY